MRKLTALLFCLLCALPAFGKDYGNVTLSRTDITEVYDGDTIYLNKPEWPAVMGDHIGVRLYGLDTPERHSHCDLGTEKNHEEALAMKARLNLQGRLDKASSIELREVQRDKYFRLLAKLYINGVDAAEELITEGLAVPYHGEKKKGWCQ
ncbi:thermonuclease family protein [Pseudomonas luteola]|uniref:thermonuclease family protein n=1 Tax=Pseudomonas luteola TaxID=47886 RepID=UPI003A887862